MKYSSTSKSRKRNGPPQELIRRFRKAIYSYYSRNSRDLPWRTTFDPYRILVSEVMLQQTQVSRVLSKYDEFIRAFPDWSALARASVSDVLAIWKGMGYSRRALALRKTAATVTEEHGGELPAEYEKLLAFPSIGKATACSILAFAFGKPTVFIETNIRAVFIRFFFEGSESVHDREIRPLVDITLDRRNPRKWYYALMDYGVQLKKTDPSLLAKSAHYRKQTPFRGSTRELRSKILSLVASKPGISGVSIRRNVKDQPERVTLCLSALCREGFMEKIGRGYAIAGEKKESEIMK